MSDADQYRTVLPAGTVLTTSGSALVPVARNITAGSTPLIVNITDVAGTHSTLTLEVERDTTPGHTTTDALTAPGRTVLNVPPAINPKTGTGPRDMRITWTITGDNPEFTLGLYIE